MKKHILLFTLALFCTPALSKRIVIKKEFKIPFPVDIIGSPAVSFGSAIAIAPITPILPVAVGAAVANGAASWAIDKACTGKTKTGAIWVKNFLLNLAPALIMLCAADKTTTNDSKLNGTAIIGAMLVAGVVSSIESYMVADEEENEEDTEVIYVKKRQKQ